MQNSILMHILFVSLRYLQSRKISFFAIAGVAKWGNDSDCRMSVMNGFDWMNSAAEYGVRWHTSVGVLKGGMYGLEDYKQVIEKCKYLWIHVTA